jgi:hypothetical protein
MHTPGPWHWTDAEELMSPSGAVISSTDYEGMWFSRYEKKEDEANAKLIAAAPELLEALKWAMKRADNAKSSGTKETLQLALADISSEMRAAIAKATT